MFEGKKKSLLSNKCCVIFSIASIVVQSMVLHYVLAEMTSCSEGELVLGLPAECQVRCACFPLAALPHVPVQEQGSVV